MQPPRREINQLLVLQHTYDMTIDQTIDIEHMEMQDLEKTYILTNNIEQAVRIEEEIEEADNDWINYDEIQENGENLLKTAKKIAMMNCNAR